MNKVRYISLLCLLFYSMAVSAQTYERVLRNNLWNESENVTGVRQDTVSSSYAEAFAGYEGGGFRDSWEAPQGWSAGAETASIRHFERMTLKGSFSFTQTEGYDMCGSMSIRPGFYPVDVMEFTPGRKTLQTYAFDGGIAYDLDAHWRIGAMMDFESANIAKRKDLRHSNWLLDMTVSPGFLYHNGDFAVGANYIFRKTGETIEAEQVGNSGQSYYAFLDKGMMYGVYNIWTGSGLQLQEAGVKGFPIKDFSNGGAVQLQYKGFFAEAEYLRTAGTIGEKEFIWFRFPGDRVNAIAGYRHIGERSQHFARVKFGWNGLVLDETVLEKVTENGVSTVINHGTNRILTRSGWSISPEYEFIADGIMEFKAGLDVDVQNTISSQMYPYAYTQSLTEASAYLGLLFHTGRFDWGVTGCYGQGWVSENEDIVDTESGVQTTPFRLEDWYNWQMEYATASRTNIGLSLRWNFWKGLYTEAEGTWLHGFNLQYINNPNRYKATISIGMTF
ncbi:MAG: hypothetical protein IKW27_01330 [Bacteroidales bacterium]|nr:hypothetical protein [Bacteroidales bacterium]